MGQKVHPTGIRLGIVKDWTSKWYADSKDYPDLLNNDLEVRDFLQKKLAKASVSRIQIERPARNVRVTIHTARPGIVIGKKGEDIEKLRVEVGKMVGIPVHIFSMRHPRESFHHALVDRIRARVAYLPTELGRDFPRLLWPAAKLAVRDPGRFGLVSLGLVQGLEDPLPFQLLRRFPHPVGEGGVPGKGGRPSREGTLKGLSSPETNLLTSFAESNATAKARR